MDLFPAIDLFEGKVVRLHQGRYDAVTVYDHDPVARARSFAGKTRRLHVVDLEGAREGRPVQRDLVRAVLEAFGPGAQVGGGVRDRATFEAYLALGAERVVLGTAAAKDTALVRELASAHPGAVVVAVDAKDGVVATDGWLASSGITAVDLAKAFADRPIAGVLYTDISKDGTGAGPNVEMTARLAREAKVPVIASGGVATLEQLRELARHPGVTGAIVGRAIYDGSLDLGDALAACRGS